MASITSAGVGSGLDVNGLVTQLLTLESRPLSALNIKETGYQAKLSAYGTLKSTVSTFQSTMKGLSSLARYQGLTATSADGALFTASASSIAVPGSYAVEVQQLAQAHKIASGPFTNVTDAVGTGDLTIQFGTYSGGVFTANASKTAQTVTIDSAHASLGGVRDAINAAKIGVTATILNDGTGNRLVISSNDTGAANSLKITVSNDIDASNIDNAGLSQLAYDPAGSVGNGKNLEEKVAAQNALLKVDGISNISKVSNTISDVIQGVTLTLLKPSTANVSTALTVARDSGAIKGAVNDFVKAYNEINKTIKDLTAYNAGTKEASILQGDTSALSILSQVRRAVGASLTGSGSTYTQLSQIGVAFQRDGSLALDNSKLQAAIDSGFGDIAGLFANVGKSSDSLVNFVSATSKTLPGSYALSVTQIATRGSLSGASTAALADSNEDGSFDAPFAITSTNDTFNVNIDGVLSGTITLAQGNYTTAAALVSELQSKINGDNALKAAGISVMVDFNNPTGAASDQLVITSSRYGSASSVAVSGVDTDTATTLGLSIASGAAGVDVAGTINGAVATGSGQSLTGAGSTAVEGLKIDILGGATGDRGSVNYSQGFAYLLDKLSDQLLGSNGPLASRSDGLNRSIQDINNRRDILTRRLEDAEIRYRKQFGALDGLLGQLRTTSDFLTQQLANLPGAYRPKG